MSGGAIFLSYFLIIASPGELGCTFSHADNNKMVAYPILLHQYKLDNRLLLFLFPQVSIFCGCQLGDHSVNQVASTKIEVAMAPKVVSQL